MPLYLDIHEFAEAIDVEVVAAAHRRDLAVQGHHAVTYRGCWVDERGGRVFCLVEAPDANTAAAVHRASHGWVAHEIHEVRDAAAFAAPLDLTAVDTRVSGRR